MDRSEIASNISNGQESKSLQDTFTSLLNKSLKREMNSGNVFSLNNSVMPSIDNTFFFTNTFPKCGYSKKGTQIHQDQPIRGMKLSCVMAIDECGIVGFRLMQGN